jgi:preprotein translocase subunit SecB
MNTTPESSAPEANGPRLIVNTQYVKDFSFENPNSPKSLLPSNERPGIDIHIDMKAQRLQEEVFELALTITAKASRKEEVVFMVDLTYAGVFTIQGVKEEELSSVLMVDAPTILFPFARRIVADVTRDGGFPPLMLEPIDFQGLYIQQRERAQAEGKASSSAA